MTRSRAISPATTFPELDCSPHNPWRTLKGAKALAPSRVWFPGRRGSETCRGAHPSFNKPACAALSAGTLDSQEER
jgi:hypothetical protein